MDESLLPWPARRTARPRRTVQASRSASSTPHTLPWPWGGRRKSRGMARKSSDGGRGGVEEHGGGRRREGDEGKERRMIGRRTGTEDGWGEGTGGRGRCRRYMIMSKGKFGSEAVSAPAPAALREGMALARASAIAAAACSYLMNTVTHHPRARLRRR